MIQRQVNILQISIRPEQIFHLALPACYREVRLEIGLAARHSKLCKQHLFDYTYLVSSGRFRIIKDGRLDLSLNDIVDGADARSTLRDGTKQRFQT